MARTATAQRMMETLPIYYWGEPLIERIVQARANEIDRLDAQLDQLEAELVPGQATDALGLLGLWEHQFDLPVQPADATENQRRAKVKAALAKLDSGSSADALAALQAAMGSTTFTVLRDTPDPLSDTLQMPYEAGTYNAIIVLELAQKLWPAHRGLFINYIDGFILDASPLDVSTL